MVKDYRSVVEPWWEQIAADWESERGYFVSTSEIPRFALLVGAAHFCRSEICNGGFLQLFNNSTGMIVPEAIEGFKAIGMPDTADVIQNAVSMFGSSYPREREARQRGIAAAPSADLDALNGRFFQAIDTENGGFESAASRYSERVRGAR